MQVLVIGGTRMIGHYLVPLLLDAGDDVTVLTRGRRPLPDPRARLAVADRRDPAQLQAALEGSFDVVIDNVAYVPEDAQALFTALGGRFGHYVLTSTAFVYPQLDAGRPVLRPLREDDWDFELPPLPAEPSEHLRYVDSKRRLEAFAASAGALAGLSVTIVRPHLQLAGAQTDDGRFAWFWLRVRDGGPIWLPPEAASPAGPCQMAYAGDVAQVLARAAHTPAGELRVFNAAAAEAFDYRGYIAAMAAVAGTSPELRFAPRERLDGSRFAVEGVYRLPLPYIAQCDSTRARDELGVAFTPAARWMPEVGTWVDAYYRTAATPPWLSRRAAEREASSV